MLGGLLAAGKFLLPHLASAAPAIIGAIGDKISSLFSSIGDKTSQNVSESLGTAVKNFGQASTNVLRRTALQTVKRYAQELAPPTQDSSMADQQDYERNEIQEEEAPVVAENNLRTIKTGSQSMASKSYLRKRRR